MHSLIFITAPKDCYHSHFTDEETEARKLNYLPNLAVLEQDLNRGCPALRGPHSHSPSKGLVVSVKVVLWLSVNMQTAFGVPLFYWQYKARFPYFCSASNNILEGQDFASSALSTFWRRNSLLWGCLMYWKDVYEQHPWPLWCHEHHPIPSVRQPHIAPCSPGEGEGGEFPQVENHWVRPSNIDRKKIGCHMILLALHLQIARNQRGKANQRKKSHECFQKKVATDTIRKDKQYRRVYSNTALFSDSKVRKRRHSGEAGTAADSIQRSRQGDSYESGLPTELSSLGDVRRR